MSNQRRSLTLALPASVGALLGAGHSPGASLLVGVAGLILGWAILKGALWPYIRGAMVGAGFLIAVGPGADLLISRTPFTLESAVPAMVVGALVGALLGVRNFRRPKAKTE